MKLLNFTIVLLFLIVTNTTYSQVGIGTLTPHSSAALDIQSSDRGVLISRVSLTDVNDVTTIASPLTSLLVFNTTASGTAPDNVTEGFYYWNGTQWSKFGKDISEFKSISGVVQNTTAVNTDDFVFGSTQLADNSSITTDTTRLFFDKSKGALRAGTVGSSQWDDSNVGLNSIALGDNTRATGDYSFSMGRDALSSGEYAISMGDFAHATGDNAIAIGPVTTASGIRAVALGYNTTAFGVHATAMGDVTKATGQYATSMGSLTQATGYISKVIGRETIAPSFAEVVVGAYNELYTPNETIAFDGNDRIFTVANGFDSATRSNALTILKNGNTGIRHNQS